MGLLFSACLKEETSGVSEEGEKTLRVGLPSVQSKTWLDYAAGGSPLKVYWSDGDQINVNGLASLAISVADGVKESVAKFQLPDVEPPYNVIYPQGIIKEDSYDSEGTIAVEIPATQTYANGSFGNGAAIMYGYAESLEQVKLQNLCAAIRVNIKGKDIIVDAKLASASAEAPLCGSFRLAPQTGVLNAVAGKNEVALSLEEVELNPEAGTDFFFTVPAGDYSEGLTFYFTRKKDRLQMQNVWHPKSALEAGKLYSFNDVEYVPMAKDIETVEEWEEFAAAMNSSDDISKYMHKGGIVRLGADLEADNLTSITATFPYVFEGNGKTITRQAATSSLFAKLTGEIRNLTLDGKLTLSKAEDAPFVKNIYAGAKITGCTNNMDVTFDIKADGYVHCYVTGIAAVAVRNDTEGLEFLEISNCTNNGKIEDADISGKVNNANGTIEDATVSSGTTVSGGTIAGDTVNNGTLDGTTIEGTLENNGTVEDAKAYMSDAMNRYALSGETSNSSSIQLRYTTGVNDEGVLYSFTKHTGSLYSIIDTELVVNGDIIFKYLNDKYDEVPGAYKNEARLQYTFTNQDKSMVITTVRVSDVCFNIDYSFISK